MAERNAIVAVYSAGIIQGVALVTFPAASAIFSAGTAIFALVMSALSFVLVRPVAAAPCS